jgi:type II secretory pathway component PulJ
MRRLSANISTRSSRRGITIIEVMIVVTGVAMLLGLCAVSIQVLMRLNTDVQGRYAAAVALERLARQLRADAHATETALVTGDPKKTDKTAALRLVLEPAHEVVYESGDGGVVRTESRAGKRVRHEKYALARGADASFELRDDGLHRLAVFVMTRTAGKSQVEPPRPLEVVALLGKDRVGPPGKQGGKPQ